MKHNTAVSRPPADPVQVRRSLDRAAVLLDEDLDAAIDYLDAAGEDLEQSFLSAKYLCLRQEVANFDTDLARRTIKDILGALPL